MRMILALLLAFVPLQVALANPAKIDCHSTRLDLSASARKFEDKDGNLKFSQVAGFSTERFTPLTTDPPEQLTHSTLWFRLDIHNTSSVPCDLFLTLGKPSLSDIQIHVRHAGAWQTMLGGPQHPLSAWTMKFRQPTFPLSLAADEHVTILARVRSTNELVVKPVLWQESELISRINFVNLTDGIFIGIILFASPLSLIIGLTLRSHLLIFNSLAATCHMLTSLLVNGYLIYLPSIMEFAHPLTMIARAASMMAFFSYTYFLLEANKLPRIWGVLFVLEAVLLLACYGLSMMDHTSSARFILLKTSYPLVLGTFFAGLYYEKRYNWLVWLVVSLLAIRFILRHLLQLESFPWLSAETQLSPSSSIFGVMLLVGTLVMVVMANRAREHIARRDLQAQQKTEQSRLMSMVAQRTTELRESLLALNSMLARISHDLRSPLASIIDYARMLRDSFDASLTMKIERNARIQLELIDELIEFSRSELQEVEIAATPGYFYSFLIDIEEEGRLLAQRQNNNFESRIEFSLPPVVQADYLRLRQILLNLISNAAKFTRNGHIVFEVAVLAREPGSARFRFSVSDDGIGIDPQDREKILLPFQRGRNASDYTGSGLGLSIVKQLLKAMGSSLELGDQQEKGSRFSFDLDLALSDQDEVAAYIESHSVDVSGAQRRILLVDDVLINREWLADLLSGYDFDVVAVSNGYEALDALKDSHFDLMLCDQMMPGLDGWELLIRVREVQPTLPAILYSAAPPRYPQGLAGHNFNATLLKPAISADLLRLIDSLMSSPHNATARHFAGKSDPGPARMLQM